MWYCPLGFLTTFVIGLLLSFGFKRIFNEQKVEPDPNLYFPVIANRIRRRIEENQPSNDSGAPRKYLFTANAINDSVTSDKYSTTKV